MQLLINLVVNCVFHYLNIFCDRNCIITIMERIKSASIMYAGAVVFLTSISLANGALNTPRYQPELDQLSLEKYISDDYLFNMHINCLLYDGPCDPVGRWMRPRMASYFLSSCILCTPNQEKEADKFMSWLYQNHPQLFQIGIAKYLDANGITLPEKSKFREQVQKMNVPKVVISSQESADLQEKDPLISDAEENKPGPLSQELLQQSRNNNEEISSGGGPNERILNPKGRRNKFSSAITFSSPSAADKFNNPIEDDEAEMDFKFYHK